MRARVRVRVLEDHPVEPRLHRVHALARQRPAIAAAIAAADDDDAAAAAAAAATAAAAAAATSADSAAARSVQAAGGRRASYRPSCSARGHGRDGSERGAADGARVALLEPRAQAGVVEEVAARQHLGALHLLPADGAAVVELRIGFGFGFGFGFASPRPNSNPNPNPNSSPNPNPNPDPDPSPNLGQLVGLGGAEASLQVGVRAHEVAVRDDALPGGGEGGG